MQHNIVVQDIEPKQGSQSRSPGIKVRERNCLFELRALFMRQQKHNRGRLYL